MSKDYFESEEWKEHEDQGIVKSRAMFQLDGLGMFLACFVVFLILFKQYYLKRERDKTAKFVLNKLANKDGSVVMCGVITNNSNTMRYNGVIESINRIPGVVVSAMYDCGTKDKETVNSVSKLYSIPKVYDDLDSMVSDRRIRAIVLNIDEETSPDYNARGIVEKCMSCGKHIYFQGKGLRHMFNKTDTLTGIKKAFSAKKVLVYPPLAYHAHPLFKRFLARLKLVGNIKEMNVSVRIPIWQDKMIDFLKRRPFFLHVLPKRFHRGAYAFAGNYEQLFGADIVREVTERQYAKGGKGSIDDLLVSKDSVKRTGRNNVSAVFADSKSDLKVNLTIRQSGILPEYSHVTIIGDKGVLNCGNLHNAKSGNCLKVNLDTGVSTKESVYGANDENESYYMLSFVRDVRERILNKDAINHGCLFYDAFLQNVRLAEDLVSNE